MEPVLRSIRALPLQRANVNFRALPLVLSQSRATRNLTPERL